MYNVAIFCRFKSYFRPPHPLLTTLGALLTSRRDFSFLFFDFLIFGIENLNICVG